MHQLVDLPRGVSHHPCPADQRGSCVTVSPNVGWDVMSRLSGNPTENRVTSRVRGLNKRDIMNDGGGGPFSNDSWPNAQMYRRFLEEHRLRAPASSGSRAGSRARSTARRRSCDKTLSITGRVTKFSARAGVGSAAARARDFTPQRARLNPVFSYGKCLANPQKVAKRDAELVAEITTRRGRRLRKIRRFIDARYVVEYEAPFGNGIGSRFERVRLGPFAIAVPVKGRVISVRLKDKRRGRILARLRRSHSGPRIELRGLKPGSRLGDNTTLRWRTRDRDTKTSRISYQVLYSADGGKNFVPIAVNQNDRRLALDPDSLPASKRRGILRVMASDGLITRTKQVTRLNIPPPG